MEPDGYTGNLRTKLLATGKFKSYSDSAHTCTDKLAKRGGIYLRNGHTLMALEERRNVMKYAVIVVSSLPVMIIYPFVQRFFVKMPAGLTRVGLQSREGQGGCCGFLLLLRF